MKEGFLTDLHTAMLFFRVCRQFKIEGIEERTALMRQIASRGKAKYLRDVAEYTKGKKVVEVKKRRPSYGAN